MPPSRARTRRWPTARLTRLADLGPALRMPHARPLGDGLFELRFTCEGTARRVTYYTGTQRNVITLTTFRKQRQNERREVSRARQAMQASQEAGNSDG
ncbi:MAG: type II toxin-antitoxin system RelE/ParE family toxin [Streptosporangiaceae bacterium]